jgi:phage-related protein
MREMAVAPNIEPVVWIGSAKDDLVAFPEEVVGAIGYALYEAQKGNKHPNAKPLHGFGGAGVLEVVEDHDGDTYRAVYTVRLAARVYVLHVFQKRAKHGIKTPKAEIDLVKARLKRAEEQHAEWLKEQKGSGEHG